MSDSFDISDEHERCLSAIWLDSLSPESGAESFFISSAANIWYGSIDRDSVAIISKSYDTCWSISRIQFGYTTIITP